MYHQKLVILTAITDIFIIIRVIWASIESYYLFNNQKWKEHQAYKIRGNNIIISTTIIIILNLIMRPLFTSLFIYDIIKPSGITRNIIDIFQMSLYTLIEYRCWFIHYNYFLAKSIVNFPKSDNFYIKYQNSFGNKKRVLIFFSMHAFFCVLLCQIIESLFNTKLRYVTINIRTHICTIHIYIYF